MEEMQGECQISDSLTSLFSEGISAGRWPCRNCRRQFGGLSTACAGQCEDLKCRLRCIGSRLYRASSMISAASMVVELAWLGIEKFERSRFLAAGIVGRLDLIYSIASIDQQLSSTCCTYVIMAGVIRNEDYEAEARKSMNSVQDRLTIAN